MRTINRLMAVLLLFPLLGMAANNYSSVPQVIGVAPSNGGGTASLALNSANTWWASSFIPYKNHTLSAVAVKITPMTGTVACGDLELDIYSDSVGNTHPNASLGAGYTSTTSSLISGACSTNYGTGATVSLVRWSGFSGSLTAGTTYWAVVKNLNGTPASNYPNIQYAAGGSLQPSPSNTNATQSWNLIMYTTNGGTGWNAVAQELPFIRFEFSDDSSLAGSPFEDLPLDTTNLIYNTRALGTQFVAPPVQLNVIGVTMMVARTGTPSGNFKIGLQNCTGGTTCANIAYTTPSGPTQISTSGGNVQQFFTSVQHIPASATIIVDVEDTATDSSSAAYRLYQAVVNSDANSLALLPFGGSTTKGVYCTATCTTASNWTAVTASSSRPVVYGFGLILDPAGEFTSTGTGGPNNYGKIF